MKYAMMFVVMLLAVSALAQDPFCGTFCEDPGSGGLACQYCKVLSDYTVECATLWAMGNWWNATQGYTGCAAHNAQVGPNGCTFSGNPCQGYYPEALFRFGKPPAMASCRRTTARPFTAWML